MGDIDIDAGQARTVASKHDDAAQGIEDVGSSLPEQPDAGMASDVIAAIVGKLAADADTVAFIERGTANIMRQIADNVIATEETVESRFDSMSDSLPG